MSETWQETTGARRLGNIVPALASNGQSASLPSETIPEPLKATPAHKRAIAELALRFPAGREQDPDQYQLRLEYLAKDTAHIAVALLRAACDRVAQTARGLPYASEILTAATQIVEERQRVQPSERTVHDSDGVIDGEREIGELTAENVERCRAWNLRLIANQAPRRVVPLGAFNAYWVQVVDDGAIVPNHVCNGDGTVRHVLGGRK
jgi:hypothetical protein